jgi:predicted lipoprotein with Yx(FWY)xxD motif
MSATRTQVTKRRAAARVAAAVAVPLLAVITAACGSTSSSTAGAADGPAAAASGVAVGQTSLGPVLVDSEGMTVYLLTADSPGHSSCAAQCLANWPAVPASDHPAAGVTAKLGQTTTPDGEPILTVGGWPLYTFVQDQAPGDVVGEGVQSFGGTWYAVSPDGQPVKSAPERPAPAY